MKAKAHHCFLTVGGWRDADALQSVQESTHLRLGATSKRAVEEGMHRCMLPAAELPWPVHRHEPLQLAPGSVIQSVYFEE